MQGDNGTNITAGEKELREAFEHLVKSETVPKEPAGKEVKWVFSLSSAPHFGGIKERLMQWNKRAIKVILNERAVTDEVLITVFAEVTSFLNGRPLTHVSMDHEDNKHLTSNHFLVLKTYHHIPINTVSEFTDMSRRWWKQEQFIINQFWKIWVKEYVPSLMERKKWFRTNKNARIGDHVLIIEENAKRRD